MNKKYLTIKELTQSVGGGITPRMVRHYHQLGLLPPARRSESNYRLYTSNDVLKLQSIVALKQQGFQLSQILQLLKTPSETATSNSLTQELQQQYQLVLRQLVRLRQTASALESLLGRDSQCQTSQAEAFAELKRLQVETQSEFGQLEKFWESLDAPVSAHPEKFSESLKQLLPDLSERSQIEVDLLSKLVLACGDVSLVQFVRISQGALAAALYNLKAGCQVVGDVPAVVAAFDSNRLFHLGCQVETIINDPHIFNIAEVEQAFWQEYKWKNRFQQIKSGAILVVGSAPSILMAVCQAIEQNLIQPALVIAMPVGFSHAPAAKRWLTRQNVPFVTIDGNLGGGLLAAVALNALTESLIEKPDCHCYLNN